MNERELAVGQWLGIEVQVTELRWTVDGWEAHTSNGRVYREVDGSNGLMTFDSQRQANVYWLEYYQRPVEKRLPSHNDSRFARWPKRK